MESDCLVCLASGGCAAVAGCAAWAAAFVRLPTSYEALRPPAYSPILVLRVRRHKLQVYFYGQKAKLTEPCVTRRVPGPGWIQSRE